MYTDNNSIDSIVSSVRYVMRTCRQHLVDGRGGVEEMLKKNPANWAHHLSWHAQSWIENSTLLEELEGVALYLSNETWEVYAHVMGDSTDQPTSSQWVEIEMRLNNVARMASAYVANHALSVLMRGPETSSSPMTAVASFAKIEAAKKMLSVAGMEEYMIKSTDSLLAIMDAKKKREDERAAIRQQQDLMLCARIRLAKSGTKYCLVAENKFGDNLNFLSLSASRKDEAMVEARKWAEKLSTENETLIKQNGWNVNPPRILI